MWKGLRGYTCTPLCETLYRFSRSNNLNVWTCVLPLVLFTTMTEVLDNCSNVEVYITGTSFCSSFSSVIKLMMISVFSFPALSVSSSWIVIIDTCCKIEGTSFLSVGKVSLMNLLGNDVPRSTETAKLLKITKMMRRQLSTIRNCNTNVPKISTLWLATIFRRTLSQGCVDCRYPCFKVFLQQIGTGSNAEQTVYRAHLWRAFAKSNGSLVLLFHEQVDNVGIFGRMDSCKSLFGCLSIIALCSFWPKSVFVVYENWRNSFISFLLRWCSSLPVPFFDVIYSFPVHFSIRIRSSALFCSGIR